MVGEAALVAGELLLWNFALTGLVGSKTPEAVNNGTIFNQVLSLTLETLQGRDGVYCRGVGRYSCLILHYTISERVEVERNSNNINCTNSLLFKLLTTF